MRLIDADALMTELMDSDLDHLQRDDWKEVIQIVTDAPTIQPEQYDAVSREKIKALEQEPCEDAVSRNLVLTEVKSGMIRTIDGENWKRVSDNVRDIRALPSVTPKQRTGKWIDVDVMGVPAQACDQCNTFFLLAYTGGGHHYCPNCGAKMEVTE